MGGACRTHVASVQDEPMVCTGNECRRDVVGEFLLYGQRGGAGFGYQPYAMADAKDVRIDGHRGLVPYDTQDDVGCFPSHTGESGKGFYV